MVTECKDFCWAEVALAADSGMFSRIKERFLIIALLHLLLTRKVGNLPKGANFLLFLSLSLFFFFSFFRGLILNHECLLPGKIPRHTTGFVPVTLLALCFSLPGHNIPLVLGVNQRQGNRPGDL